ncbi:cysteine hydrolase family protein [Vibrio profundi]|uniref:cysteine hydrolase family protein n=1 Tax=Vibrio profundi TaxID=1774960 RepID=UPI0037355104
MTNKALLVIDLQNDYFEEGKFPLWNTQNTLTNIKNAIDLATERGIKIIHIQHIADSQAGPAPFFNPDTDGANIHPEILNQAPDADVVIKHFADSFEQTELEAVLQQHGIDELLLCGMMTQNCVTHTAISKAAEKYNPKVIVDCCTTVDEMIHNIALHAISTRIPLLSSEQAFS